MSLMGTRVKRVEDARLLTAGGTYIDDVEADDAAHVVFVRATVAHASFCVTDRAAALAAPGVLGVHLFEDLALEPAGDPDISAMFALPIVRPWLARDVVRFIGEPIAAVVATTRAAAVDAAELVAVDYEPLPTVVDVEAAMRADAPVLFAGTGTNVVVSAGSWDDDPEFFADCEVVVRERIVNSRVAAAPLETRGAISRWRDGRLEHSTPTQRPHGVRDTLAGYLGLAPQAVRLRTPDVGGGFGVKIGVAREEVVVAQLARLTGRCLRWYETRSESLQAMGHGRAQVQYAELGGTRDGHFVAYRLRVVQEAGAYPDVGAILPIYTGLMAPGVYGIERVAFASRSVLSNTAPTVAFRGAGRPEATAALERMVDVYATAIGMDPAALRRRNVIGRDAFPFTTPTGAVYDSGDYEGAIDKALDAAGYAALRDEQQRRRAAAEQYQLGIGLCVYVEITNAPGGSEASTITVHGDGRATVTTGSSPTGQGHETTWAMLVADRLGIAIEDIRVVFGDTDAVPTGRGTMGSSSVQVAGIAVDDAAIAMLERARSLAADELEANANDLVAVAGGLQVAGTPAKSISWAELAGAAERLDGQPLMVTANFEAPGPTFPFGAQLAVVEVDTETGESRLVRLVAVDDAGTVINPELFEGQLHGGYAQGVAQALYELVQYDRDGNLVTGNFADYAIVTAAELPSFDVVDSQTPTPYNALGVKGVGESGTIGSTPAVHNAVIDALAHLGIRHLDMPVTPERVWRAIGATHA
ncbi:MAG: molybdopterin-dependent oxidoreductase [Actinobacteria bacterium]|uniref:Unannotated protein n=1 Tax=freshwater metagenome TaxID=449393 RepID=A0A6J6V5V0_9ZZZZ|nr:molybdopterin-dependent oxidoreductase [Actinomycetota bacterium]MSX87170.1 molybdopterin-dependent oxidoreductase [Actinomycetota bacterium]MSY73125.1 molybdopterin-dependent oxidoreductase [Actinomycetota bacterium]